MITKNTALFMVASCVIFGASMLNAAAETKDIYAGDQPGGFIYQYGFNSSDKTNESSESSFFNLGNAHKVLGYSAFAAGLTAAGTGFMIANNYSNSKNPSSTVKSIHSASAGGTAVLAVSAAATGFLAYSGMINLSDGVTTYNTHMILGVLSTLGFIVASAIAPENEGSQPMKRSKYSSHCGLASASGMTMFATVVVIQF